MKNFIGCMIVSRKMKIHRNYYKVLSLAFTAIATFYKRLDGRNRFMVMSNNYFNYIFCQFIAFIPIQPLFLRRNVSYLKQTNGQVRKNRIKIDEIGKMLLDQQLTFQNNENNNNEYNGPKTTKISFISLLYDNVPANICSAIVEIVDEIAKPAVSNAFTAHDFVLR